MTFSNMDFELGFHFIPIELWCQWRSMDNLIAQNIHVQHFVGVNYDLEKLHLNTCKF